MTAVGIDERVVIAPVVYPLRHYLERRQWQHQYWLELLSIALAASLDSDPLGYLFDVYAQSDISPDDLRYQVDETHELCDILFNEYADYLEPLRERNERNRVIFNVRDLQYSGDKWTCVLQTIYLT